MYALIRSSAQDWHWRVPVALQLIFILITLSLSILIPESPRWLASHGKNEWALDVIARLADRSPEDSQVQINYNEILDTVAIERETGSGSWSDLIRSDQIKSRRRFLIACGIQAAQQLGGINVWSLRVLYIRANLHTGSGLLLGDDFPTIASTIYQEIESLVRCTQYLVLCRILCTTLLHRQGRTEIVTSQHHSWHGRVFRVSF